MGVMMMVVVVVVVVMTAIMVMVVMVVTTIMVVVVMIVRMIGCLCLEILVRLKQANTKNQRQWHLGFCRSEYPCPRFHIANPDFQGIYIGFIHQVYFVKHNDVAISNLTMGCLTVK